MIELDNLTKKYGDLVAVDRLTLKIEKGETFGLLGPNGAGKTTTIRMLLTLTKPTSGRAIINGYNVREYPEKVKKEIGVVPQHINLDNELTARENLDLHGKLHHMSREDRRKAIAEVLEYVELADRADDKVEEFSGGMKRRLMIARAIMHRPIILFLDEPTVGLDPQTRRKIWDLIRGMKRKKVTILLTTHYIEEAEMLCDRVGIIDYGRLIALDSPENLKISLGKVAVELYMSGETKRKFFNTRGEALSFGEKYCKEKKCDFTLRETNLEDVFIEFTGRRIRE
jgi:ABC-2 type transport system ATP-binding protein